MGDVAVPLGSYTEDVIRKSDETMGSGFITSWVFCRFKRIELELVRSKVLLGEADAAFVYKSDARNTPAGVVELPEALSARARYVLAGRDSESGRLASQFRTFLGSDKAMEIFRKHEFSLPEGPEADREK